LDFPSGANDLYPVTRIVLLTYNYHKNSLFSF
jgi:hypothetical protein